MTPAEQEAIAGEELRRLIERRQNKIFAVHNVEQNACNDTHGVLASVSRQVRRLHRSAPCISAPTPFLLQLQELHGRTGNEFLLFAVRSEINDLNPPFVYYTGDNIADYMKNITKESVEDTSVRLEAYSLLGDEGMHY